MQRCVSMRKLGSSWLAVMLLSFGHRPANVQAMTLERWYIARIGILDFGRPRRIGSSQLRYR
jgi:hypothetical protein